MPVLFMDAGQMTARVDLEVPLDTPDGQGGAVRSYCVAGSFWARIEPLSAAQQERAGTELFTITHRIWVRFRDDLSMGMRLRKGDRIFTIRTVHDPDETRRYLVCRCEEDKP